jgi:hypothetical protein
MKDQKNMYPIKKQDTKNKEELFIDYSHIKWAF